MNSLFPMFIRALFVAAVLSTAQLNAADHSSSALPGTIGVTISLTTSSYEFPAVSGTVPVKDSNAVPVFPARVSLYNHTSKDIPFTFSNPGAAANPFVFQLSDSAGNVLWQSNNSLSTPQVITDGTLHHRSGWKYTALVPLAIGRSPLPAGTYTLDVSVAGTPEFGATTTFQVTQPTPVPDGQKGVIDGSLVGEVSVNSVAGPGNRANAQSGGAVDGPISPFVQMVRFGAIADVPITIFGPLASSDTNSIADVRNYENQLIHTSIATMTDSAGKFKVALAPGRYFVNAEEFFPGTQPMWGGRYYLGQFVTVHAAQTSTVAIDVWKNWY